MNQKVIKTIRRVFMIITLIILALFLTITAIIYFYSPGKPDYFKDKTGLVKQGSISEKTYITIGGVKQGMFIRGTNINNPVLLYVHGGPAFPNFFLIDKYKPGLEEYFTVCYWEQRGGGLSYNSQVSLQSMTLDQLSSDAIEVTNYLRNRFGKEKIYIMAHSGGTTLALLAAKKRPELYFAYIAMAQITKQAESERIAYRYMLEKYRALGKIDDVNELLKYKVEGSSTEITRFYKSAKRDQSMHELGIGTMRKMNSVFMDIFMPVWTCKAYTVSEKINIWKSKFSFLPKTNLINELLTTDFTEKVPKLEIPVYFISGKYDLTVNKDLSREYLNKLQAPVKGFYTFENSAHSPIFEETEKLKKIIHDDVLNNTNNLADKE